MDWISLPFNQILEQEIQEWKKFRWALRKEDQQVFDHLFEKARIHVEAGNNAARPWPFETILISILLEQEKALVELREKIRNYEDRQSTVCQSGNQCD
jgi:hypothetical protein